jgi:hypothetical protein
MIENKQIDLDNIVYLTLREGVHTRVLTSEYVFMGLIGDIFLNQTKLILNQLWLSDYPIEIIKEKDKTPVKGYVYFLRIDNEIKVFIF